MNKNFKGNIHLALVLTVLVLASFTYIAWSRQRQFTVKPVELSTPSVSSYEECMEQEGRMVQEPRENYPEVCVSVDGFRFLKLEPVVPSEKYVKSKVVLDENEFATVYNEKALTFTLNIPSECELIDNTTNEYWYDKYLMCKFDGQSIRINPHEGGRGLESEFLDISSGKSEYGGFEWSWRTFLSPDLSAYSVYSLTHPITDDHYLIGVNYEKGTDEAKEFVNSVFSTMIFSTTNH